MHEEYSSAAPHDYAVGLSSLSDVDGVRIETTSAPDGEWFEYRRGERLTP